LFVATALQAEPGPVTVDIKNARGESIGVAQIFERKGQQGVTIRLTARNLPAGSLAAHIHQNGSCEAPDFSSAGPHLNPQQKQHGLRNPEGPHAGDMPNLNVRSNGRTRAVLHNSRVTLGDGENSLFANGGTALVIHAGPDDMKSDPAGNAGDRIACGVIRRSGD
jgi:Cu-Zn family superoxide dismutase